MNLEDHLGDIIRKARTAAGVSATTAARAAGLSADAFGVLEQSGETAAPLNFTALAGLIGLDAAKLAGIAQGWRPEPRDLTRWRELHQITTTQRGNAVNCFLVWDESTREAALFDTGWEASPVVQIIEENRLQLRHLFITHSHEDHVAALGPLRQRFPGLLLHTNSYTAAPEHRNQTDEVVALGGLHVTHRAVPGHADDGVIYLVDRWPHDPPRVAVVGDTLFAGSLARGFISIELLKRKVEEEILTLPPDTLLCPGHGPVTTVGEERAHNPFI